MKKSRRLMMLFVAVCALCMLFGASALADTADPTVGNETGTAGLNLGTNGKAAQKLFGIEDYRVIILQDLSDESVFKEYLTAVKEEAAEDTGMWMLYVMGGSCSMDVFNVPNNVALVSEADTTYTFRGTNSYFIKVFGSVYGGKFVGNSNVKNGRVFLFNAQTFKAPNGIVSHTDMSHVKTSCIEARGSATKGCQILDNKISDCGSNGIRSCEGSTIALIKGNTISDLGQSGIDLTSGHVTTIQDNNISNAKGHGICTDSEHYNKAGCTIKNCIGNTIKNVKIGVYMEEKCKITGSLKNNTVSGCKGWGVGTHKKAVIKGMSGNKISACKQSNVGVQGTIYMVSNNIIEKGKAAGIAIDKGGKLYIKGKNNIIRNNKNNGIQMMGKCWLYITGKNTQITGNRWGINIANKGVAKVWYAVIKKNKKGAIYYLKKAKLIKKGNKFSGKVYHQK